MKKRIRKRRILKWLGVLACVALLSLWLISPHYSIGYGMPSSYIGCASCSLVVLSYPNEIGIDFLGWSASKTSRNDFNPLSNSYFGWPQTRDIYIGCWLFEIPIWMFFSLASLITAGLWRWDRAPKGGCANCGYDLTGNVSGVCPECGAKIVVASISTNGSNSWPATQRSE